MIFTGERLYAEEILYRGVFPGFRKAEEGRPTSACFKDSRGVSVNRSGDDGAGALNHLALPDGENDYHSEIHKDENTVKLTTPIARRLAMESGTVRVFGQ